MFCNITTNICWSMLTWHHSLVKPEHKRKYFGPKTTERFLKMCSTEESHIQVQNHMRMTEFVFLAQVHASLNFASSVYLFSPPWKLGITNRDGKSFATIFSTPAFLHLFLSLWDHWTAEVTVYLCFSLSAWLIRMIHTMISSVRGHVSIDEIWMQRCNGHIQTMLEDMKVMERVCLDGGRRSVSCCSCLCMWSLWDYL